jgi:hypothetical protein
MANDIRERLDEIRRRVEVYRIHHFTEITGDVDWLLRLVEAQRAMLDTVWGDTPRCTFCQHANCGDCLTTRGPLGSPCPTLDERIAARMGEHTMRRLANEDSQGERRTGVGR